MKILAAIFCLHTVLALAFLSDAAASRNLKSDANDLIGLKSCNQLLADGRKADRRSNVVGTLAHLVQLGLQNLSHDADFRKNLLDAFQAPFPVNPFLNLASYQGQALAQQADPLLDQLTEEDWISFKEKLAVQLGVARIAEEISRADAQKTSLVESYQMFSLEDLFANSGYNPATSRDHSPFEFVGRTATGHFIFRVFTFANSMDLGIVSIPSNGELADVKWLIRFQLDPKQQQFPDEWELAKSMGRKIWVVGGKLYAALESRKEGAEQLAEFGPATGRILLRVDQPGTGGYQFWKVGSEIIGLRSYRLKDHLNHANHEFYRLEPKQQVLVPLGLGFVMSDWNEFSAAEVAGRTVLGTAHGLYRTDLTKLYRLQSELEIGDRNEESKDWSATARYISPLILDGKGFRKVLISEDYKPVKSDLSFEQTADRKETRIFAIDTRLSMFEEPAVQSLPKLGKNLIFSKSAAPIQSNSWLVDLETLEVNEIPPPRVRFSGERQKPITSIFPRSEYVVTEDGDLLLIAWRPASHRVYYWRLNVETRRFEDLQTIHLVGIPSFDSLYFSRDGSKVLGGILPDGIFTLVSEQLTRSNSSDIERKK